jgi:rhodanese-related sulfurtransferase
LLQQPRTRDGNGYQQGDRLQDADLIGDPHDDRQLDQRDHDEQQEDDRKHAFSIRYLIYELSMPVTTTLLELGFDEAVGAVDGGAVFVDLRPSQDYLDVHIPGSLGLMYEFGPGMAARARDCVPLDVSLILLDDEVSDCTHAAASLRGKGFEVLGKVTDAVNKWAEARSVKSTEVLTGDDAPDATILDVGDPGAKQHDGSTRVPMERLWMQAPDLAGESPIAVIAGFGVRAALAVGILEHAGTADVLVWMRRRR